MDGATGATAWMAESSACFVLHACLQVLDWEGVCARCEQVEVAAHLALLGVGQEPMRRLIHTVGLNDLQVGPGCGGLCSSHVLLPCLHVLLPCLHVLLPCVHVLLPCLHVLLLSSHVIGYWRHPQARPAQPDRLQSLGCRAYTGQPCRIDGQGQEG